MCLKKLNTGFIKLYLILWKSRKFKLSIDIGKTKMVQIVAYRAKRLIWKGQYGLKWTTLCNVSGVNDFSNINKLNIKRKQKRENIDRLGNVDPSLYIKNLQ